MEEPTKVLTPYGGRLIFKLPGGTSLVVHLKDKTKIRNKKRWSQVMYMYYLLGYKYFGDLATMERYYEVNILNEYKEEEGAEMDKKRKKERSENGGSSFIGFGNLLRNIDPVLRRRLENTFILTLDGDVEFRPNAIQLMMDKIRENKRIGSVCGRVHPIGTGFNFFILFNRPVNFLNNDIINAKISKLKVLLFGTRRSSTPLATGCRKCPSIFL
jgi:chitin synthase